MLYSIASIIFTHCYGLGFFWLPRDAFESEKYSVAVKNNDILKPKSDLSELELIIRKARMQGVKIGSKDEPITVPGSLLTHWSCGSRQDGSLLAS